MNARILFRIALSWLGVLCLAQCNMDRHYAFRHTVKVNRDAAGAPAPREQAQPAPLTAGIDTTTMIIAPTVITASDVQEPQETIAPALEQEHALQNPKHHTDSQAVQPGRAGTAPGPVEDDLPMNPFSIGAFIASLLFVSANVGLVWLIFVQPASPAIGLLIFVMFVTAIIGIGCGITGMIQEHRAKKKGRPQRGRGFSLAAFILMGASLILSIVIAVFSFLFLMLGGIH